MTPYTIAVYFDDSRQFVSKSLIRKRFQAREMMYYYPGLLTLKTVDLWLLRFKKLWEDRYRQLDRILSIR